MFLSPVSGHNPDKADWYCWSCSRNICNKPPGSYVRDGGEEVVKPWKHFFTRRPHEARELQRDGDGEANKEEYGECSCYIQYTGGRGMGKSERVPRLVTIERW